jgi:hypothetical protein
MKIGQLKALFEFIRNMLFLRMFRVISTQKNLKIRAKYGNFMGRFKKVFLAIKSLLTPLALKLENFGKTGKLASSLFFYGESGKIGPETICRAPRFKVLRILLTFFLNPLS